MGHTTSDTGQPTKETHNDLKERDTEKKTSTYYTVSSWDVLLICKLFQAIRFQLFDR